MGEILRGNKDKEGSTSHPICPMSVLGVLLVHTLFSRGFLGPLLGCPTDFLCSEVGRNDDSTHHEQPQHTIKQPFIRLTRGALVVIACNDATPHSAKGVVRLFNDSLWAQLRSKDL